jgi:hypothetical protein
VSCRRYPITLTFSKAIAETAFLYRAPLKPTDQSLLSPRWYKIIILVIRSGLSRDGLR